MEKQVNHDAAQTEYCGEFTHNGARWGMNFFAADDEDAFKKAQSVRDSFKVIGVLDSVIPFNPPEGWKPPVT